MRSLLPLLFLALLPTASAQVSVSLYQTAVQPSPELKLNLKNIGKTPAKLLNWSASGPNCYQFRIVSTATGQEIPQPQRDCAVGNIKMLPPGQTVTYLLGSDTDLLPGEYRFTLPLNIPGQVKEVSTLVRVGSPFFASLALSAPARAGQPVPLSVVFLNISHRPGLPKLCPPPGLIIRNVNGRTVYDNEPERLGCKTGMPLWSVAPGQTYTQSWPRLPALAAGDYTAVMWGEYSATLGFKVSK